MMKNGIQENFNSIIIFTDGACTGNPGPGGWAAVMARPEGDVREFGGFEATTTNNRMEMRGALEALRSFKAPPSQPVTIYTDSVYLIRGITQWIWGWRSRGWKNAEGKAVSNQDLWEDLAREVARIKPAKIDWKFVKGHSGVPGNERCDEIATRFAHGKWVDLYKGPLIKYSVAIYDLPPARELPEMKPREAKAAAFSYLSYYGGLVMRHGTWAECERRVKGQSGAKFKKAATEADESEILRGWGLDPKSTVIEE